MIVRDDFPFNDVKARMKNIKASRGLTCAEGGADHLDAGPGSLSEFTGSLTETTHTQSPLG